MSRTPSAAVALAVALAAGFAATPASAQFLTKPSFYVSAAGGQSHADADCTGWTTCERSDTAFKVIGGINLNRGLAAELTYYSLGSAKFMATDGTTTARMDVKGSWWGIGLAGHYDFNPMFGALIRGGWAQGSAKTTYTVDGLGSASEDRNGRSHWYFGAGARIIINPQWMVNVDYDVTRVSSFVLGTKTTNDASAIMAGATFTF